MNNTDKIVAEKIKLMNEILDRIIPFPDTFSEALHLKKAISSLEELLNAQEINTLSEGEERPLEDWHNDFGKVLSSCICEACNKTRTEITKRVYMEYVTIYGMPINERAISFPKWLDQRED